MTETTAGRIRALPLWQGAITVEPLHGGLSNENFLVVDDAGRHVVRFGSDYPFHHVCREREAMTARAAHEAGFAPALEYYRPGVMVSAHLGARTFTPEDVRENLPRVARIMRGYHDTMAAHVSGAGFMFWVFHVIRDYARTLEAGNSRKVPELGIYLELADELEKAQLPLPIVFGHNDLLPANLLDTGDRLWLIDFEYAGFSTAMFDLAGLSSNAGFSPEETEELLGIYFDATPTPALRKSMAAMQCASLLRESMWSMVSELHLNTPGVDFVAYADENLERLDAMLDAYRTSYGKA